MTLTTRLNELANQILAPANLRLGTLTADQQEKQRLVELARAGAFSKPIYPVPRCMEAFDPAPLKQAYEHHRDAIERLKSPGGAPSGYDHSNTYFTTPDTEVLYLLMRMFEPRRVVEVGSGNSTRIMRQAVMDGGLDTEIVAIDPQPRIEIEAVVDRFVRARAETLEDYAEFDALEPNDILFIDSSHEARVGNDVARLFLCVLPRLKPGVVIHVHDIFLPFEYPLEVTTQPRVWTEQYVLQSILQWAPVEVLWPGYYVQAARPDLHAELPFLPVPSERARRDGAVASRAHAVLSLPTRARGKELIAAVRWAALSFWFRFV